MSQDPKPNHRKHRKPRAAETYRAARRNRAFGRKPVGNTGPDERRQRWKGVLDAL